MFDFEIFVLIYVSKHSESIPTKTSERRGALQSGQIVSELGSYLKLSFVASELGSNPTISLTASELRSNGKIFRFREFHF